MFRYDNDIYDSFKTISEKYNNIRDKDFKEVDEVSAIVIGEDGRVEKEVITNSDDNHGSATKRALAKFGVTNISGTMGFFVAQSANAMNFVVFHTYANNIFAYLPLSITYVQYNAMITILGLMPDFNVVLYDKDSEKKYKNMSVVEFMNYIKKFVKIEIEAGIQRYC